MTILVTGAAGFIGFHVAAALLERGQDVIGADSLSDYYDPRLKQARLALLQARRGFRFVRLDIGDREAVAAAMAAMPALDAFVHLAAQAGVRYSLEQPFVYADANLAGQLAMLEAARAHPTLRHFVYASSSSVYGGSTRLPFAEDDPADRPLSLYGATKRAGELMAYSYSHLYGIKATGLRFFTVYGPWGRPDMAPMLFARAILAGQPIPVFNDGRMARDFTFIDDVVAGVLAALDRPPAGQPPHRLYNLGRGRPEALLDFIGALETALGRKAVLDMKPMQPGDVPATAADITAAGRDLGYAPVTTIGEGVPRFVAWYREFYRA